MNTTKPAKPVTYVICFMESGRLVAQEYQSLVEARLARIELVRDRCEPFPIAVKKS